MYRQRIKEALLAAIAAGGMQEDEAAFLIGMLPHKSREQYTDLGYVLSELPEKFQALVKEVDDPVSLPLALLRMAPHRERQDTVGRVVDLLFREYT